MRTIKSQELKAIKVGTGGVENCEHCGCAHPKINVYKKEGAFFVLCPMTAKVMKFNPAP